MKIIELKTRPKRVIIDRQRMKLFMILKSEISSIADISFNPREEWEYYQLPEPYATQAEQKFNEREENLAAHKKMLMQSVKGASFTKKLKVTF